ncbi:phage tail protein [Photorhabdus sp. SF281]|uniref:phage tail protein n=1 Tax=Photorhabdus sp. SF281 TaxID=3459527 RepID=UPI004043AC8F
MAKNDFKAFATGENANTLSQEEYESLGFIEEGFKSGIARSEQLNKVWRQSSIIAAVIGKYIAEKTGEDVIDDGDLEKLVAQLDLALKQKITAEIPDASLTRKGISQLNNATNSDREDQAATPKAVNDVRKMAEGKLSSVADATLSQKGIVQLSSATDSANETLAATPRAVKGAYDFANTANVAAKNAHDEANRATDNANSRLAKNQNGADIPNKGEFIKNLGLAETVSKANNAVPGSRKVNGKVLSGDISLNAGDVGACRAYSGSINTGGGTWTTKEFIVWLKQNGAFDVPCWMCKGSWSYAGNRIINDTGCGNIFLAGAVVEVMGVESAMTIRVTTPTTTNGNGIASVQFTYINNGETYSPGWRRDYNTANKPTAGDVGAFPGFIFVNNIPTRSYVGAWGGSGNGSAKWAKGLNIGTVGSDVGQLFIDSDGNLYAYFLNNNGFTRGGVVNSHPVGSPIPWPQPNPPSGYLTCNGQAFNKSLYPQLAAAYPSGTLPDLRGEFIRGWDDGRGVDSGRGILSWQHYDIHSHSHGGVFTGALERESHGRGGWGAMNTNGTTEAAGGAETRPRNIAFNYIVRAA